MFTIKRLISFFFLLFLFFLISCEEEKEKKEEEIDKMVLLTEKEWKLNNYQVLNEEGQDISFMVQPLILQTYKIDLSEGFSLKFEGDGTGIANLVMQEDGSNVPKTVDFTWNFNEDRSKITLHSVGEDLLFLSGEIGSEEEVSQEFEITQLDEMQLNLKGSMAALEDQSISTVNYFFEH
ncbi:hypothetical protein [Xanthovirga aplysinae]|uniref:hypothetical protein n=1 Tax=Xanthovirga aplysinae TaxID=2529853 RepID=UPI0012BBD2C8|nr:hypothetical protein [Xanthovirga aplysinae]MTI32239.1 hypothetical protein [Xanthovirga aplysinae]